MSKVYMSCGKVEKDEIAGSLILWLWGSEDLPTAHVDFTHHCLVLFVQLLLLPRTTSALHDKC